MKKPRHTLLSRVAESIFVLGGFILLTSCASLSFKRAPIADPVITQREALTAHNAVRRQHHVPALTWDNALASYAENYASQCHFKHSHTPYGENLAEGFSSVTHAVNSWADEAAYYSYKRPGFSHRTGHFTQMIWKSTERVGCGYAICNGLNGTIGKYLVCEYSPAGNIVNAGYFSRNVLP